MAIELKKVIPEVTYFTSGNIYIGSICKSGRINETTFNYKISPDGEFLNVEIWFGMYCIGLSSVEITKQFPLTQDGINDLIDWINTESENH